MNRKRTIYQYDIKLITASVIVGLLSALLGLLLKHLTEFVESFLFKTVTGINPFLLIGLPSIGITAIYFLRKYAFQNRKNKGILEIYKTLDHRKEHLPFFKIPSHFINGFLTVVFGGSTGIEVSTVVSTAAIGNAVYNKEFSARMYKRELICAGVTAGVAVLFGSPLAGILFALEVIAKQLSKSIIISCVVAALVSWGCIYWSGDTYLFHFTITNWHWTAIPLWFVLSMVSGCLSAYFTTLVIRLKKVFSGITSDFVRVNLGALSVGAMILCIPVLFGDSYHGLTETLHAIESGQAASLLLLFLIAILKPLAAALTLGAGGDGGVFAPSIVAGAFLGIAFALLCNNILGTNLILINFAVIGMAATLSGSLHAPLTASVLACSLMPGAFVLLIPIIISSYTAKWIAAKILPYNVYTHDFYLTQQPVKA